MKRSQAIIAIFLLGALAACDQSSQQAPAPHEAAQSAAAPPARGPWPFLATATGAPRDFDPKAVIKRNYYVVFDASGSMSEKRCAGAERKIDVAKRALLTFAGHMPSEANIGLLVFDQRATRELVPIGPISKAGLADAIGPIEPGGDTPLADAIRRAYAALTARAVMQLG
jgi:Ca-activated chloride channel family protein